MNKCIHMGRLTKDPEIRTGNTTIAKFTLAVDRRFKREGEPEADFFNYTAFSKQAEFVDKYLKKGTKVLVTSRVQNDNYTNKNGEKVYAVNFLVDEIEFAESKNAESKPADKPSEDNGEGGWMDVGEAIGEDLPFL